MRRLTLTIGLLLIMGGLYILNQGAQFFYPIAGATGLISNAQSQVTIVPSTLLTIAPSNYTYLAVDLRSGIQTNGRVQVEGGSEIGFYIMNIGNFSEWRRGHPAVIEFARPDMINYNFTFISQYNGRYCFIFNNQEANRKNVVFTLTTIQTAAIVSPFIQYAGYEALLVGVLLSIVAIKTGRRPKPAKMQKGSRCKFCGKIIKPPETFCSSCGRSQN